MENENSIPNTQSSETTNLPDSPPPQAKAPQPKNNRSLIVFLAILVLILASTTAYFAYTSLKPPIQQADQPPTQTTATPTTTQPSITTNPTTPSTPTTQPSNKVKLTYTLKPGWETINDKSNQLQAAYDPSTMQATSNQSSISITTTTQFEPIRQITYANIRQTTYDGGSRHNYIYEQLHSTAEAMKLDRMDDYYEVEYNYDGKSCLVLYNQGFSASGTTWGMCVISPNQAVFIEGTSQSQTEEIIATIKVI